MADNSNFKIDLNQFIDVFDMPDTFLHFLNKTTGEIVTVERSDLASFEDGEYEDEDTFEDYHDWQRDKLLLAKDVHTSDDYLELPRDDLDDYDVMENFCFSFENDEIKEKLLYAIQGKGAFGRFRAVIHSLEIENMWYKYRHEAAKNIAIKWCKKQGFAYAYGLPPYLRM